MNWQVKNMTAETQDNLFKSQPPLTWAEACGKLQTWLKTAVTQNTQLPDSLQINPSPRNLE